MTQNCFICAFSLRVNWTIKFTPLAAIKQFCVLLWVIEVSPFNFTIMKVVEVVILGAILCVPVLGENYTLKSLKSFPDHKEAYTVKVDEFVRSYYKIPGTTGICSEGLPCGYIILSAPRHEEIFIKGDCDCPEETKCNLDAVENSAYVYRCTKYGKTITPMVRRLAVPPQFPVPE